MSYVYIQTETTPNPLYTVGFYPPGGRFEPESDHKTREEAAARVNYLNGGAPARTPPNEFGAP